jgi:hypothetical protein
MSRTRILVAALLLAASPASAQEILTASDAEKFVAGKVFSYSCFDGTEGAGRIFSDGSASGTVEPMGKGMVRHMRLPAGTLYVQNERICANLRGLPFQPCFTLVKTSETGFRGSIAGMGFMYCDFERGSGGVTRIARSRIPNMELRGSLAGAVP